MTSQRQIQVSQEMAHMAADFFARESNGQSLVTVTRADVSPDLKNVTIFFTTLPDTFQETVLHFARRNRTDFREYIKKHAVLKVLPHVEFEIDFGERNRQRIDDLTRN